MNLGRCGNAEGGDYVANRVQERRELCGACPRTVHFFHEWEWTVHTTVLRGDVRVKERRRFVRRSEEQIEILKECQDIDPQTN